jgi:short-subunit dehydrogenase
VGESWALVTGGSSGIGLAFAERLAERGHDLVLVARDGSRLEAAARRIRDTRGVDIETHAIDLSTPSGVDALLAAIADRKPPTVVVANAGMSRAARVGVARWEELESLTYLLSTGVIRVLESVVPPMAERGSGDVVVVSSISARIPMPGSAVYAATKAAVSSYARSAHRELRPRGVRVVTVEPGYVRTNLHAASGLEHLERRVPRWLWLEPARVVDATERALERGRASVVPGVVYRIALPFLGGGPAQRLWRRLTKRR